ncbi:hypothetical protein B4N84_21795 [Flavobacterium sp. IR1]|nr:hypothetical protein B4N84_21795 [Flavobacterium sp. IR1]
MKNFTLAVALLITCSVQSQIGMGTPNPDPSAVLELASTQKGFLPPRLTTLQRNAIVQPPVGLTIFNTIKNCLEWYNTSGWYNACGDNPVAVANYTCNTLETGTMTEGIPVSGVSQTITADVSTPGSYDISATNNGVTFSARGNFTSKGKHDVILHATGIPMAAGDHDFILNTSPNNCTFTRTTNIPTVKGTAGKIWMAYNLGATKVPTAPTDTAGYGDLYQWGRATDGHEKRTSLTTTTLSRTDTPVDGKFITPTAIPHNWRSSANHKLWQGGSGTNNPCPAGFRIPTLQEFKDEITKSNITNIKSAFYNTPLKLVAAGLRESINGNLVNVGGEGSYWSSDIDSRTNLPYLLSFYSGGGGVNTSNYQALGFSVRCIQE